MLVMFFQYREHDHEKHNTSTYHRLFCFLTFMAFNYGILMTVLFYCLILNDSTLTLWEFVQATTAVVGVYYGRYRLITILISTYAWVNNDVPFVETGKAMKKKIKGNVMYTIKKVVKEFCL